MFAQVFKNVDDVLWKDPGCSSELDYIEQTSWLLFLKYLHDLEADARQAAELDGKPYTPIIKKKYQWGVWAAPKKSTSVKAQHQQVRQGKASPKKGGSKKLKIKQEQNQDGRTQGGQNHGGFHTDGLSQNDQIDHTRALTGDDLKQFVDDELFPYLRRFKHSDHPVDSIEYKIGEIFGEIKNKFQYGRSLREVINLIDGLHFRSSQEQHEMSHLYETKIKNMGNAGRNGGEYYTPRALIRAIVKRVDPQIGETVYDGAVGSAGFLCEAFEYLKQKQSTTTHMSTLQKKTFYGKEKKSLAYIIGTMNMIFHGLKAPNIQHTNTLSENLNHIQERDRFNVVLANPPFGGKERSEVQQNFPIKTGETAFLFLQHFIKMLKAGGRAGVVIKNTFLSNTDNASISLRKELLQSCNLHTVLVCPRGVFLGAGVQTVVLFFKKGEPTQKIWYYQLDPGRNLGKTNPLNEGDLKEFLDLAQTFKASPKSWQVKVKDIDVGTFDLSVKNPNTPKAPPLRHPQEIAAQIKVLDRDAHEALQSIKELL